MKTLIVYFSHTGHTAAAAARIAESLGADLLALQTVKPYPARGAAMFLAGGKSALFGEKPPLKPYDFRPEDYEQIIFGFPVWASSVAPPLRTFIKANRAALGGKRLAAFACQAGSGGDKARLFVILYSAGQVLFEYLRQDQYLRWSFVRVSQLTAVLVLLGMMIAAVIRGRRSGRPASSRLRLHPWEQLVVFLNGAALVIMMEFANDKWPTLPNWVCYAIMAEGCLLIGYSAYRVCIGYPKDRAAGIPDELPADDIPEPKGNTPS